MPRSDVPDLLILVGLIGAGKTTEAKQLQEKGWVYVDFDLEWHDGYGNRGCRPQALVAHLVRQLNSDWSHRNVVIDGWWTWNLRWWENEDDVTLGAMCELLKHHTPDVRFKSMNEDDALAAFRVKHPAGLRDHQYCVADADAYAASLPARHAYLVAKLNAWHERWSVRF